MNPLKLAEIAAIAADVRAIIGDDDAETILDTVDGETDALDILDALIADDAEARAMQAAAKAQADALRARAEGFDRRSKAIRAGLGKLLDALGERKVTRPGATVSRTKPRESVDILDAEALPQGFFKVERKPLSKEIGEALKAGEDVPGAALKVGSPGLMVRT